MKTSENKTEKRRPTLIDLFVIIGALLLVIAVVGQDVAVYMINRGDRSERFDVVVYIPSLDASTAEELKNARISAGEMQVIYDGTQLGTVNGGFTESSADGGYVKLKGDLRTYGKTTDGECRLYGYNRVFRQGDRLYVIFEDAENGYSLGCTVEISEIKSADAE